LKHSLSESVLYLFPEKYWVFNKRTEGSTVKIRSKGFHGTAQIITIN